MLVTPILKYFPSDNADYRGNELIECLPPLTRDMIARVTAGPVEYNDEDRAQSVDLRIQYCARLLRFFMPLPEQVDFAFKVWSTICQAYTRWNPSSRSAQERFYEMVEAMADGSFLPEDDCSLWNSPLCITQVGTPGTGKSEIMLRLFRGLCKDALFHHTELRIYQLLYLWVEAPNSSHEKGLAWVVYSQLYQALIDTGATHPPLPKGATATQLGVEAALLARKLNLGIIVVDEIQHCMHFSAGMDSHTMEFLTAFINRVKSPVLLIGTWKAVALVSSELRLGRRATSLPSRLVYSMKPGPLWDAFNMGLMRLQYTTGVAVWTPEFSAVFYEYTRGIQDIAVKLMAITQQEAIASGLEMITIELVKQCAELHLPYIVPAIKAMRSGSLETDVMIWDAEPTDFEAYYKRIEAECVNRQQGSHGQQAVRDPQVTWGRV